MTSESRADGRSEASGTCDAGDAGDAGRPGGGLTPLDDWGVERVLCVAAHPDDLQYGAAAAVDRWTRAGDPAPTHVVDVSGHLEAAVRSLAAHARYLEALGPEYPSPRELLTGILDGRAAGRESGHALAGRLLG